MPCPAHDAPGMPRSDRIGERRRPPQTASSSSRSRARRARAAAGSAAQIDRVVAAAAPGVEQRSRRRGTRAGSSAPPRAKLECRAGGSARASRSRRRARPPGHDGEPVRRDASASAPTPEIAQHQARRRLGRVDHARHARAGVRARADDVEPGDARVAVVRAKVRALRQARRQRERRAVERVQPSRKSSGVNDALDDDLAPQIGQQRLQAGEDAVGVRLGGRCPSRWRAAPRCGTGAST